MGKLIMPKQTSEVIKLIYTLQILNDAHQLGQPIVSNYSYKQNIIAKVSSFTPSSDSAMLVKQSELARYFGFALGNFEQRNIQITPAGIEFYKAFSSDDHIKQYDLIVDSITTLSFGRNNSAIKNSDSDIDTPKLFIKSIISLKGITNSEFKSLLSLTNDFDLSFESALSQIVESRKNHKDITIHKENINKYNDSKFPPFLVEIGFCYLDDDKKYKLSSTVINRYFQALESMSIYNAPPKNIKNLIFNDHNTSDDDNSTVTSYKGSVANTLGYSLRSVVFEEQNSRIPIKNNKTNQRLYKIETIKL